MAKEFAVVVGAAGNMGTVICDALVKYGLRIIAVGRTESALATLASKVPDVTPCSADIASDSAIAAIQNAVDGPVRLALNCAGVPVRR